jgi:hypothetical protein
MKRNRKKVETYRLNGYPHLNTKSIHPVNIAELELRIAELERKLLDANDSDDKKWTTGWLTRYKKELAKKTKGLALKADKPSRRRRGPLTPGPSLPEGSGEN